MPDADKNIGQQALLLTASEDVKWHYHIVRECGNFLQN